MTTPAGWYDDGSGRQRWWDGTQWTEHFAPVAAPEASAAAASAETDSTAGDSTTQAHSDAVTSSDAPDSPAAAETAASLESVAAVETPSWNAPASQDAETPAASTADDAAPTDAAPSWSAPAETPAEAPSDATVDAQPAAEQAAPDYTAPAYTPPGASATDAPVAPYTNNAPAYPGSAPTYPGSAAPEQQQAYQGAPGYPGAAPSYPAAGAYPPAGQAYAAGGGYPYGGAGAPTAAPTKPSVLGIVGLGLAALGTILSCIPVILGFGWLLLAAGFIVSLISLFLKGKKWPGISGLILSVVGAIVAVVMAFVFIFATVAEVVRDLPTAPPSSDSDTGTDDGSDSGEVLEGELGSPLTIEQMSGTSEVTINSATWATSDGSSIPSTNGGYVILDVTFTGISGTSYINPFYVAIETAEGAEGTYDYYVDGIVAEELAAGDTVTGTMTFDVAQSDSYEVIFTDELLQEVARVSITASAG